MIRRRLAGAVVLALAATLLFRSLDLWAAPPSAPWQQLPPAPGGKAPPVVTLTPTCVPRVSQPKGQTVRRYIFINGWDNEDLLTSHVGWPDTPKRRDITHWDALRDALKAEANRRGDPMDDSSFHYYSYRGELADCGTRKCPFYSSRDTRFRGDNPSKPDIDAKDRDLYDRRAEYLSEIIRSHPDARFAIIGHSLGGAVAMYWAGTASDDLVRRVDFIATLGSPLGGQPGACFQNHYNLTAWLPSLVHEAIVRGNERTNVLTLRNSHDSVVKPEAASIFNASPTPTVWRDLKTWLAGPIDDEGDLKPNRCAKTGHTELTTSEQVIHAVLDAAFPGTVVSLGDKAVACVGALDIGAADHPRPFDLVIRWPVGSDVVQRLQAGQASDVEVRVDGKTARVTRVTDLLPWERVPELFPDREHTILFEKEKPLQGYHRFRLRIQPPQRHEAGTTGLSIAVEDQEDRVEAALRYLPPDGVGTGGNSQTVMVVDTSNSMSEDDASGNSKIEAAQRATQRLSRMIANESRQAGVQNQVALVTFSGRGNLLQSFTSDLPTIEASIDRLQPNASTNMSDGLREATDALDAVAGLGRRTLILLSDGLPNEVLDQSYALDPRQEVRDVYVPRLQTSADCVYVVGLGEPADNRGLLGILGLGGSIDEPFLQELAAAKPDCGGYYAATDAGQLAASFLRSRHLSTGGELVIDEVDKPIAQGETSPAVALDVPYGSGDLNLTLDWPGSQLDMVLTDPRGLVVQPGYQGAELFTEAPPVQAIVRNPLVGKWTVSVYGRDIPAGQTRYSLVGSVRSAGPESGSSGVPMLVLIALGLGVLYFVAPTTSGSPGHSPLGHLILHGPKGIRAVAVTRGPLVIGRAGSDVAVIDSRVSRQHARLRTDGGMIIIEDMGSANGTWVNGRRIQQATVLRNGDRLRFGNVEAEWQQDVVGPQSGR